MNTNRSSRGLSAALRRRKVQVAGVALSALLVASAIAVVKPRDYRAQTRLQLTAKESAAGDVVVQQVQSIAQDVLDRSNLADIIAELELAPTSEAETEAARIQRVESLVTELVDRTEVSSEQVGDANQWTVTIAHTSGDADLSHRLVGAIAGRYEASTLRRPEEEAAGRVAAAEKAEVASRNAVDALKQDLAAFDEENAAFLEGPERRLAELRDGITAVERDEIGAQQAEVERLDAMLFEEPEVIESDDGTQAPNPMFRSLQEAKLEAEGRIAGARRKLSALRGSEREILDDVRHAPEIRKKRDALAAELSLGEQRHSDDLAAFSAASARLAAVQGAQSVSFAHVDPPVRPDAPVGLGVLSLAGIGLLVGAGLGAGLAFALDSMDGSFRQADEVQRALGLPTLGAVQSIQTPAEIAAERSEQSRRVTGLLVMSVAAAGLLTFALVGDAGAIHDFVRAQLG